MQMWRWFSEAKRLTEDISSGDPSSFPQDLNELRRGGEMNFLANFLWCHLLKLDVIQKHLSLSLVSEHISIPPVWGLADRVTEAETIVITL